MYYVYYILLCKIIQLNEDPEDSCIVSTAVTGTWRDLFESSALKPITIVFALFMFQELSGIDAILFFTVDIFAASGATLDSYYSTIIVCYLVLKLNLTLY